MNRATRSRISRRVAALPIATDSRLPKVIPFDPARQIACGIVKVPYGQVYVDGMPESVRSFEMNLGSKDRTCFIPAGVLQREAMERECDRAWASQ